MKHSHRKGSQVIRDRLTYGRTTPLQAIKRERKRGRDLTRSLQGMPAPEWVVENWPGSATILAVRCRGTREGKPVDEIRYYVTSLRTSARALLRHVRDRWSIENCWHWPRDTQLKEDTHRYRETNGVQIMATLRSLAMNALRLDGFWSITEGLAPPLSAKKSARSEPSIWGLNRRPWRASLMTPRCGSRSASG